MRSDLACPPIAERPATEVATRSASSGELVRAFVTASALDDLVPSADPVVAEPAGGDRQGLHFIQEDSPHEMGAAVAGWIKSLG